MTSLHCSDGRIGNIHFDAATLRSQFWNQQCITEWMTDKKKLSPNFNFQPTNVSFMPAKIEPSFVGLRTSRIIFEFKTWCGEIKGYRLVSNCLTLLPNLIGRKPFLEHLHRKCHFVASACHCWYLINGIHHHEGGVGSGAMRFVALALESSQTRRFSITPPFTHCSLKKQNGILETTFSNTFSWMRSLIFLFKIYINLSPGLWSTISHNWSRQWLFAIRRIYKLTFLTHQQ